MSKRRGMVGATVFLLVALFAWTALGTDAELYFSSDIKGQNRVTNVQEGDSVFIVVYDPDENIDCDVRDKIWTDIKLMDPKTGAYIVWISVPDEIDGEKIDECEGWQLYLAGYDANLCTENPFGVELPWKGHEPGNKPGSKLFDYLEETGADTGLFVSKRSFQIGTRVDYNDPISNTHVVDNTESYLDCDGEGGPYPTQFQGGNWGYWFGALRGALWAEFPTMPDSDGVEFFADGFALVSDPEENAHNAWDIILMGRLLPSLLPPPWQWYYENDEEEPSAYVRGLFQNMDTLVGMYQDPNDATDVALGMMKIIDTEATIVWDQEVYKDANTSATITVTDPDENLNCNEVEYVPVFIIVNPGSWNPVWGQTVEEDGPGGTGYYISSPTTFCALKTYGGVDPTADPIFCDGVQSGSEKYPTWAEYPFDGESIRWYNIYDSGIGYIEGGGGRAPIQLENQQETAVGSYYMQYAVPDSTDAWCEGPTPTRAARGPSTRPTPRRGSCTTAE